MPIRPEFRHHYRTPEWHAVCAEVDARANGRCENCACPGGFRITRTYGTRERGKGPRVMFWRMLQNEYADAPWIDQNGKALSGYSIPDLWEGNDKALRHRSKRPVVLTHAHLNQDPSDHRPENVRLLCEWCHNMHDGKDRAMHAAETRKQKKDEERPLLVAAISERNQT